MSLEIRPATATERAAAALQWTSSFQPHSHSFMGNASCTIGSSKRTLAKNLWKKAHLAIVDTLTCDCPLDVLVHESAPDIPLGWICYDGDLCHYVYTIPKARRKGVGTMLLKSVNAKRLSHTTEGGIALWEKTR